MNKLILIFVLVLFGCAEEVQINRTPPLAPAELVK